MSAGAVDSARFGRGVFAAAALVLLAAVVPRLAAPWAWDDITVIAFNRTLAEPGSVRALVTPDYYRVAKELSWRPASTALHVLGARLFQDRPLGHRILNLGFHLLASFLFVLALRRFGVGDDAAWAVGGLFLAHPVHLETILCVSFNEEILVLLGWLVAWLGRMRWAKGGKDAGPWLAVSAAGFGLSLLAKETGLLGLPVLFLLERLHGEKRKSASWWPHAAVAAAFLFLRLGPMKGPDEAGAFPVTAPLLDRLYFSGAALWAWIRTAVLPYPLRIEYFAVPPEGAADVFAAAAGWAAVAAVAYALWPQARRAWKGGKAPAVAGVAWALLALLPTLNLVPAYSLTTRYFAERWAYVPLAGACLALAALLPAHPWASAERRWSFGLWAGLLALLGLSQAPLWGDETRLWKRLTDVYPWSAKAREGLGQAYFRRGRYADALEEFEAGMDLRLARTDRVLGYYVPLFEDRSAAAGLPVPLDWESASSHLWLARAWTALGRNDLARPHLERAETLSARGL